MRHSRAVSAYAIATVFAFGSLAVGAQNSLTQGSFKFDPLPSSAACTAGGNANQPFLLPDGFTQHIVASQPDFPDLPDMNTLNETGPSAGRFLYRTHEISPNAAVSVTDLQTGETHILAQRADWERFDGIAWTPWGTILAGEEVGAQGVADPNVPQAQAGLVYEIDPLTGAAVARPALGSKSHEGIRFDPQGNAYGISESGPGFIFRFVPDRQHDLSAGQLFALKITMSTGDRTGEAEWVPLDRTAVQVNANTAASAVGATGYTRPEDVEIATSTGNNQGGSNTLYVAITGENRVLAIDLREPQGRNGHDTAFVYDYVKAGLNVSTDFTLPDNLALDKNGNLYIAEDPATAPATHLGDDIWVATPNRQGSNSPAETVVRFASLTDCSAEPTGIYFDKSGTILFVNAQHRGGDGLDKCVAIVPTQ
ncbi:MAG TPA: alkaline phosphatase PhoX [Blastocatellia bacterium]|nr:alkaline phosphatase PhoX [Blastocatellia bacterium]